MKQRGKKSLKITDAVVRGGKNAYEFEVFPIETEFESQSAVYIFSQRKTDKKGRGHQKFFCVGQTVSLDGDFSKYKKQFASKYKANVICVRIEEEENLRLKIEEELKAAYNISCSNNLEKATAKVNKIPSEKKFVIQQISNGKDGAQLKTESSAAKTVKGKTAKPLPKKVSKIVAKKVVKTVAKKVSKTPEVSKKKVSQNRQVKNQSKVLKSKSLNSPVKLKNQKQKTVLVKGKTVKTPATKNVVKNKVDKKKSQKSISTKAKNGKVSNQIKVQKTSKDKKPKNANNGKNNQKLPTKEAVNKAKVHANKSASRKQLAF